MWSYDIVAPILSRYRGRNLTEQSSFLGRSNQQSKMALLSYACGKENLLRFVTIPTLLKQRAAETPNKAAHVFRTEERTQKQSNRKVITFKQLEETSHRVASSLLGIGIQPNDNIAILANSCPEYVYMELACLKISVLKFRLPLNFIHADELLSVLERYEIKALVVGDDAIMNKLEEVLPGFIVKNNARPDCEWPAKLKQFIFLVKLTSTISTRLPHTCVDDLSVGSSDHLDSVCMCEEGQDPEDPSIVYPTSGSTGKSKFVVHSHFSVINGFELPLLISSGTLMSDRPMSWAGGTPLLSVIHGKTIVHIDSSFTTRETGVQECLKIAEEEQATAIICMLYLIQDILKETRKPNGTPLPKSLKTLFLTGERVPQETLNHANQKFENIVIGYASTECLYGLFSNPSIHDSESLTWMDLKTATEMKICDDYGKIKPRRDPGNVLVRSSGSFSHYANDPDMTGKTIDRNGWVKTGDIGVMNDHGQIQIIGRSKDIISRGGNKIYPCVIEGILIKHPMVQKVVVVPVPDKRLFNEICACIVTSLGQPLTEVELLKFCQKQSLDDTSMVIPKYFMFCDEYPTNVNGKLDRMLLSQMAVDKFNLASA